MKNLKQFVFVGVFVGSTAVFAQGANSGGMGRSFPVGSSEWERSVLEAPFTPELFRPRVTDTSTWGMNLRMTEIFGKAFSTELCPETLNREIIRQVGVIMESYDPEILWERFASRFNNDRKLFEEGLEELNRVYDVHKQLRAAYLEEYPEVSREEADRLRKEKAEKIFQDADLPPYPVLECEMASAAGQKRI